MDLSSTTAAIIVTVILAVIPIWAWQRLNSLWLRPKRLERLLRAQGLQGDPYNHPLVNHKHTYTMMNLQEEAKSKSIGLSHDAAPCIFSPVHQTVHKYGKKSFLWEGTTPKVIITDPEQIKEIFNKMHDFPKPELSPIVKILGAGLPHYEGEKWAKHRKVIRPAFHLEKLKDMLPAFSESCHDMISKWEGMLLSSNGICEIDVMPFLKNLTRDVISRSAFGSSYEQGRQMFELLQKLGHLIMPRPISRWWHLPKTSSYRRVKEIEREMNAFLEGIIKKREKAMKDGEEINDLLQILLKSNQNVNEGHENNRAVGMSKQEVIEELKTFYIAGQETTSVLLVWTMVLLSRYPKWQACARDEVLQVFGNQNPNFDGLSRLKNVTMVLYEVLRLYPPTIYFNRVVQKDVKLGNLSLPAGVRVSLPILLIHHDQHLWGDDAKEFKPERFSEGIAKATKGQVSFFPFGWGPRVCIGQNFALLEAKMVLSLLLQKFSFELSPTYAHAPTAYLSLMPKHGAHITLRKL